ncbi:hypothetical protein [Chryseobacterium sp. NFX27]|jgi:hypothetical protein|uniref:hypothetical protein n=1 Tax=Chryseobacterium sp. NFX27 TaxID=2819618 RepID=UPI003CE8D397
MQKKTLKLKKKTISSLDQTLASKIKGGELGIDNGIWTGGCTDGCGGMQSVLMCTHADCTADCTNGVTTKNTSTAKCY